MSKNIIFLINVKHDKKFQGGGNTLQGAFEWSYKSWSHYAKRHGAEIFVLDEPLFDVEYMKPNWFKMYILDILEANEIEYDQVLYVDYDTIVTPTAPNIFDLTEHKFCAVRNFGDMDWVCRSIENYSKYIFNGFTFPYYNYFNSGVMVSDEELTLSVSQYIDIVNRVLKDSLGEGVWIQGEIEGFNNRTKHTYFNVVERSNGKKAAVSVAIWEFNMKRLKPLLDKHRLPIQ